MTTDDFISAAYLDSQRYLHAQPRGYGGRGDKWAGVVLQLALAYEAASILDYGCGAGSLARALSGHSSVIRVSEYDPAIPGKDALPEPADLVVCTDVLEHIEPDKLPNVLAHLKSLAKKAIWMVVSTKTSNKVLLDGRNAHLIVRPGRWWKKKFLQAGFTLQRAPSIVRQIPEKEWSLVLLP